METHKYNLAALKQTCTKFLKDISFIEYILVGAVAALFIYFQFRGFTFYFRREVNLWAFVIYIFFFVTAVQIFLQLMSGKYSIHHNIAIIKRALRSSLFFYLMILFHFNLKSYVPLINQANLDAFLVHTDTWFGFYISGVDAIRSWINTAVGAWVNSIYLWGYLAMFLLSFIFFHFHKHEDALRMMLDATFLTSIIGTLVYVFMPAFGPFIYSGELHMRNVSLWNHVVTLGYIEPEYMYKSLAAMPSLHVGHAIVFLYMSYKYMKWLLVYMLPMTIWIFIDAVYLQWHYVLDLFVGLAIAVFAIVIVERLYQKKMRVAEVEIS